MNTSGNILVLAYPDTFVTVSDEWVCKFLPLVGLGTKEYIKAGHAALVLIENDTGNASYYDFGRYVTPDGKGRVRGANTDAELEIPFKAKLSENNELLNLDQFLLWLDGHPEKTHGSGRLIASVCEGVDYNLAKDFIETLQRKGSIRYGAFAKNASNCSRFVTDTILTSTSEVKIKKALRFNKKFTPSTVGNVEKAAARRQVFEVFEGVISEFKSTAFKENIRNYFDRNKPYMTEDELESFSAKIPSGAQKLSGIGSSAWFEIVTENLPTHHFRIRRYNDLNLVDYDGVYYSKEFVSSENYSFTYDSNCEYCHVIQDEVVLKLQNVMSYADFSLSQKMHSA